MTWNQSRLYRHLCLRPLGRLCHAATPERTQAYGYAASAGIVESCEGAVLDQLIDLRRRAAEYASRDGNVAREEFFFAEQNARLALDGSVEFLLHSVGLPQFALFLDDQQLGGFVSPLLERAIGVIYRSQTERQSHYFHARLTEQFDALVHIDRTTALVPLEPSPHWYREEVPETYPTGL